MTGRRRETIDSAFGTNLGHENNMQLSFFHQQYKSSPHPVFPSSILPVLPSHSFSTMVVVFLLRELHHELNQHNAAIPGHVPE